LQFFIWSFATVLPVYAKNIFYGNEKTFGFFGAALGLGATFGALIVSYISEKINKVKLLFFSKIFLIFSVLIFALSKNLIFSIIMLIFAGFGFSIFNTLDNSLIQEIIPDYIRGRIMSIYVLMFGGVMPFGSMYITFLANYFGVSLAIISGLMISLIFLLVVFSYFNLGKRLETLLATTK